MEEILKKLLESDVLSEETKAEVTAQFNTAVETFMTEERSKLEVEIRSQLTEQFVQAREELAESVDAKVEEFLNKEFDELKEDINKFRDLEVEYAEKLVEEKEKLAQTLSEQLNQLVDKIDAFLEVRLDEEMAELKEDIDQVKKFEFGRKIFEAVEAEFKSFRKADLGTAEQELAEAKDKLADATRKINEMEQERLAEARNTKIEELLSSLSGNARESMKIILSNVATEKLDESYKIYIGRVLKETSVEQQKPTQTVLESGTPPTTAKLVTGNEDTPLLNEDSKPSDQQLLRIRKLAGLSK
jgi:macrodomain Ter protein organizer (MatP/YcbG family)